MQAQQIEYSGSVRVAESKTPQYNIGCTNTRRLNDAPWHLLYLGAQPGTSSMSPSWRLKF